MSHPLDIDKLRALGLEPEQLGEPCAIASLAAEGVDEGFVREVITLAALSASVSSPSTDLDFDFVRCEVAPAQEAGLVLSAEASTPGLYRVQGSGALQVQGPAQWVPDPCVDSTVYLQLDERYTLVRDGVGGQVLLWMEGEQSFVTEVRAEPLPIEPLAPLQAPVASWLAGESHDDWLVEQLEELAGLDNPWSQATAVATYGRLRQVSAAERAQAVEELLTGRVNTEAARHLRWVRGLDPAQLRTLEALALDAVGQLHHHLDLLGAEVDPGGPEGQAFLLDLCHQRDDLEGVLVLLREVGHHEAVQAAAAALDQRARELLHPLSELEYLVDERLRRVLLGQPEAWWANLGPEGDWDVLV